MIKKTQNVILTIGDGDSEGSSAIQEIDSTKSIAIIQGWSNVIVTFPEKWYNMIVEAYVTELSNTQVKAKWQIPFAGAHITIAATVSITIVEYI